MYEYLRGELMLEDINIQQLIDTYVVPWSINIVMALVIFIVQYRLWANKH